MRLLTEEAQWWDRVHVELQLKGTVWQKYHMDTIYVEYYIISFFTFIYFYQTLTTHITPIICKWCNCWAERRNQNIYFGLNRDNWIGFATLLKSYEMSRALFTIMMSYCICKTSFVFRNIRAEEKWLREYFLFSVLYLVQ